MIKNIIKLAREAKTNVIVRGVLTITWIALLGYFSNL